MKQIKGIRRRYPLFIVAAIFNLTAILMFSFVACDANNENPVGSEPPAVIGYFVLGDWTAAWVPGEDLPDPTREGYNFLGWYEDDAFQIPILDLQTFIYAHASDTFYVYACYEQLPPTTPEIYENVRFSDKTIVYDGTKHTLTVENVPNGATVKYDSDGYVDAGIYDIYATLSADGYPDFTLMATLTISPAPIDDSLIVFSDKTVVWDGEKHNIQIESLPGCLSVQYVNSSGMPVGDGYSEVGQYEIRAVFTADINHIAPDTKTATLTILNRYYDVTFVRIDGTSQVVSIGRGELIKDHCPDNSVKAGYAVMWDAQSDAKVYEETTVNEVAAPIIYTVSFNSFGVPLDEAQETTYTVETSIDLLPISLPYFEFGGWYEDGDFDSSPADNIPIGSIGNKSFTALFTPIEYTVQFNLNGGANDVRNCNGDEVYKYTALSDDLTLYDPTYSGYSFDGWYDGDDRVFVISADSPRDITLEARWTIITYNIEYDPRGGTLDPENPTTYNVKSEYVLLKPSYKAGYDFMGWRLEGGEILDGISGDILPVGGVVIYAEWQKQIYDIKYVLDGGYHSGNPDRYDVETEYFALNDAHKLGYNFTGWYDGDGHKVDGIGGGETPLGGITLTAGWSIITYAVSYDCGGGDNSADNPQSYDVNTPLIALKGATKAGYEFLYWQNEDNRKVSSIAGGEVGDIKLTAVWQVIVYHITYVYGGDKGDNPDQYTVEDCPIILADGVPRTGFTFLGWFETQEGVKTRVSQITKDNLRDYTLVGEEENPEEELLKQMFALENVPDGYKITAYDAKYGNVVVIPAFIGNVKVVEVASGIFGADITSLTINAYLESLELGFFDDMTSLQTLVLPATLTSMHDGCLSNCRVLRTLDIPFVGLTKYNDGDAGIYYGFASLFSDTEFDVGYQVDLYRIDSSNGGTSNFDSYRYVPSTLESVTVKGGDIAAYSFYGLTTFKQISLYGCKSIGMFAFDGCSGITCIALSAELETLHNTAFFGLEALAEVRCFSADLFEQLAAALSKSTAAGEISVVVCDVESGATQTKYVYSGGEIKPQ